MTTGRGSLTHGLALALVGAATTWVAMCSWRGFTEEPSEFLTPLVLVGGTVAVSGALLRGRIPAALVFAGQVLIGAMIACWLVVGTPIPVGSGWTELLVSFDAAVDSANTFSAPVPHNVPPVHPLLIFGGLGAMLLVDLLACTLRRVPLAGLALLTVYSIPVGLLEGSVGWGIFLLTAVGFLMMLFLHEAAQISRWGRPLGPEATDRDITVFGSSASMRTSAGKIGGVATALAVVVPILIPTVSVELFDLGFGSGGDSEIKIENPMTDLQRDLKRGEDFPLVTVVTDDPDPGYLRIAVLNRFSDNEWSNGDRDVPDENQADGEVPFPPGLNGTVKRAEYDYDVSVTDRLTSRWLPTQSLVAEVVAPGDWRYDESTMDFISSDDDLRTDGLDYTMRSIEPDFQARALAASATTEDDVSDEVLELPNGISREVRALAEGVTQDAPTNFQKAVALQTFFRETGGFEYDLQNAPVGNGVDDLEAFLDESDGRVGYCEQFASAMAVMARMLDIPARVAVGFLTPLQTGADEYEYSTHDLHAWPELYFEGAGWVRFEPTPGDRAPEPPEYTLENVPVQNPTFDPSNPTPSGGESETIAPGGRLIEPQPSSTEEREAVDQGGFPWFRVGGGLAFLLLAGAALVTPRLLRRSRREQRLEGGPELAWEELWATATDLRLPWPEGRSPRQTRLWLTGQFGAPGRVDQVQRPQRGIRVAPEAVEALDRIVDELELLRYSRRGSDRAGALRDDVLVCVEALQAGVVPRVRRRATWWPRSVLRRPRVKTPGQVREQARFGGVVEHI